MQLFVVPNPALAFWDGGRGDHDLHCLIDKQFQYRSILSFKTMYRLQTTGREYTYDALWIDLITGETGILDLSFDAASAEWFVPDSK